MKKLIPIFLICLCISYYAIARARMNVAVIGGSVTAAASTTTTTAAFCPDAGKTGDLGIATDGASNGTSGRWKANKYTAGGDICVTVGEAIVARGVAGQKIKVAIYADNGGAVGSLIECSNESEDDIPASAAWIHVHFATPVEIHSGTDYWVAMICSTDDGMTYKYDAGTGKSSSDRTYSSCAAGTVLDQARAYSVYVSDALNAH